MAHGHVFGVYACVCAGVPECMLNAHKIQRLKSDTLSDCSPPHYLRQALLKNPELIDLVRMVHEFQGVFLS